MIFIEFLLWAAFEDDEIIIDKLPPRALINIRNMIKYDDLISLSIIDLIGSALWCYNSYIFNPLPKY